MTTAFQPDTFQNDAFQIDSSNVIPPSFVFPNPTTNPFPVVQLSSQTNVFYNLVLYTPVVSSVPFSQNTWINPSLTVPLSAFNSQANVTRNLNTSIFSTLPFNQSVWANPVSSKSLSTQGFSQNWLSFYNTVVASPFSQYAWANPITSSNIMAVRSQDNVTSQNWILTLGPIVVGTPFSQSDWPNPVLALSRYTAIIAEDNVWQNPIAITFVPPVVGPSGTNPWIAGTGKMMNR